MFHVNHTAILAHVSRESLADAELGEDRAEHFLDVDGPGNPPERISRPPQLLGPEFKAAAAIIRRPG